MRRHGEAGSGARVPVVRVSGASAGWGAVDLCALDGLRAFQDNRRSIPITVRHQPERAYGSRLMDVIDSFGTRSAASAIRTQVHRAPLKDDPVAMKVVKRALRTRHDIPPVLDEVAPASASPTECSPSCGRMVCICQSSTPSRSWPSTQTGDIASALEDFDR